MSTDRFEGLALTSYATGGVREVTSKDLHDGHAKALAGVKDSSARRAVVLTNYHRPYGYVLPASMTDELVTKAAAYDAFTRDVHAARPYVNAAAAAGASAAEVLEALLPEDLSDTLRVDFAGLAALMSRTPVSMVADESGGPVARVSLGVVTSAGSGVDEDDYSAFDDEA